MGDGVDTSFKEKWTEAKIQDVAYIHCAIKNHEIIVPNSKVFDWEADLISVTRTGRIFEYEIKISKADFKADAKKERTKLLSNPIKKVYGGKEITVSRPNYFCYFVPDGMILPEEVPEYAGLIYAKKPAEGFHLYYGRSEVIKEPKLLHRDLINGWQRLQLGRALTNRFWRQRLTVNHAEEAKAGEFGE